MTKVIILGKAQGAELEKKKEYRWDGLKKLNPIFNNSSCVEPIERINSFESKFTKTANDECWNWFSSFNAYGYGEFIYKRERIGAHRYSYALYKGEIINGLHILHSCDNPKCVNPNHLRLGTHQENMKDMADRNRHHIFSKKWKLSLEQVKTILLDKRAIGIIANEYNVHYVTILDLKTGRTWSKVHTDIPRDYVKKR
jgi:hypothetical protein